jgi:hypothetical protein
MNPENPGQQSGSRVLFLKIPSIFVGHIISLLHPLMRRLFLLAALPMLAITSCQKYDEGFTRAMVIYGGDLTVNGCGYLLRFEDGSLVKPAYLASAYQHDSLGVLVKYYNTGNQTNCVPQDPYDIVGIDEIKRDR